MNIDKTDAGHIHAQPIWDPQTNKLSHLEIDLDRRATESFLALLNRALNLAPPENKSTQDWLALCDHIEASLKKGS